MSGGVTLTGVATAVSAAAAAASAGLAISNAASADATSGSGDILSALTGKASQAANLRSSLLSTAGQSGGSPLSPGSVGGTGNLFGN